MKKKQNISAIILAGGKSTRMNGNKALLPVYGKRLIEKIVHTLELYFKEIIISAQCNKQFDFLQHQIVLDEKPGNGPLMGILSALRASGNPVNFVIACDIPEINLAFIEEMIGHINNYDIVVPLSGKNKYEPLFSLYNKDVMPKIEELLSAGEKKISCLFPKCNTKFIPMKDNGWFYNLNTLTDYNRYLKKYITRINI